MASNVTAATVIQYVFTKTELNLVLCVLKILVLGSFRSCFASHLLHHMSYPCGLIVRVTNVIVVLIRPTLNNFISYLNVEYKECIVGDK